MLLASLDEDAEIEEAWASEVNRRVADIESGAVQVIPIAEALAQLALAVGLVEHGAEYTLKLLAATARCTSSTVVFPINS